MLRAGYPILLDWSGEGGLRFYPGSRPAGVITGSPRMVTEWLLTRSTLIKNYKFIISGYVPVYVHCIYSQSISCRRSLSLFSLWFCLAQHFYQKAWIYEFITTITIQLGESFQSFSVFLMFNTLVLFTYFDVHARLSIFDLRLLSDRRTILIGRGPHLTMISSLGEVFDTFENSLPPWTTLSSCPSAIVSHN